MFSIKYLTIVLLIPHLVRGAIEDQSYWLQLGKEELENALNDKNINGIAKNVILFTASGMGLSTTTSTRIYSKGEDSFLSFEKFPHVGVLKTYNTDNFVPDSGSAATAVYSGIKGNYRTSGLDYTAKYNDCPSSLNPKAQINGILSWAQTANKATGFVTNTRVTHQAPSALFAHSPNPTWECEASIPPDAQQCKDIARQLIEDAPGKNINVIMGGGRQCLQTGVTDSPEDPLDKWACKRKDNRDLIKDWQSDKQKRGKPYTVVINNEELESIDKETEYVLGIFAKGHLKMNYARDTGLKGMPSLANMTSKAIDVLAKNPKGFVMVVQSGLVDFGHHRGHAKQALDETVAFNDAVVVAIAKTNPEDTLIIVTGVHDHTLVFTGYSSRKSSILDIAENSKIDHVPYTSLLYGVGGPNNYQYEVVDGKIQRSSPLLKDTRDFEYSQQSGVVTDEVTHSGSDVLVYAKGPMAHLFQSVHEATYVAYVIGYAAQIGPFEKSARDLF